MSSIKVAGIQMTCGPEKSKNLKKAAGLIEMAAERNAKIICLQELFNTIWFPKEANADHFDLAEPVDGESITTIMEVAKKTGTVVIVPFFEKDPEGAYYNSAAVIDEKGGLLGIYRKAHIPDIPLYEERYYFKEGDKGLPVFDTKFGRIGIQICWDNFYPEGARTIALKGARIIFAPTAAAFASQERWRSVLAANAITNGLFVFRVNRVGNEEKHNFYGQTFCLNPEGEFVEQPSGMGDGIYEVEIDLSSAEQTRKDYPYMKYRRPVLYGKISEPDNINSRQKNEKTI